MNFKYRKCLDLPDPHFVDFSGYVRAVNRQLERLTLTALSW